MLEEREGDKREQVPIALKNVSPAIPKRESKLQELIEDRSRMGCEGLLAKPWNLRAESTLREFLFERGNQWFRTIRQDSKKWTTEVWAGVYGFPKDKGEGWASRRDNFMWENSERIRIRRTDSIQGIDGILGRGES